MRLEPICTTHGLFAQARVEPETVTIFKDWTCLTTNHHGEMFSKPLQGFSCANTCFMTGYEVLVNGQPISHRLSAQLSPTEWASSGAISGSQDSGDLPLGTLPKGAIEVRILRKCDQGLSEQLFIKNNGMPSRDIHLEIRLFCPILDRQFEEEMKKDKKSSLRGVCPQLKETPSGFLMKFERIFGKRKKTPTRELHLEYGGNPPRNSQIVSRGLEIFFKPREGSPRTKIRIESREHPVIQARAKLGSREELCLDVSYVPIINGVRMPAPKMNGLAPLPHEESDPPKEGLQIESSNSTFNLLTAQAMSDLRALRLPLFEKSLVSLPNQYDGIIAGIPRYIGVFGRDTVIAGWQSILFDPNFLEPALSRIALYQGKRKDAWRDEEPFRMLHERRLNPKAQTGQLNRNLYYGDVTATPFWILALSSLYRWTGNRALITKHWRTLIKCCEWIINRLDQGNGFIYYAPDQPKLGNKNRNQAWKDSGDAIVDHLGRIRTPPLAVAEVQGYAYHALREAADLLEVFPELKSSIHFEALSKKARKLKTVFNRHFWLPDENFYAVALDRSKIPLRARASNIGHCLAGGIVDSEKEASVVQGLMAKDLFSGWGVRTLSSENPAFDPFSYHRGSVWPVENALIAEGMAIRGFRKECNQIVGAQLNLAALLQHMRLPEVIGGQERSREHPIPGIYNHANLLQAWSVSAISQFVQSMLGIRPRADQGYLELSPYLPDWLPSINLENLQVGQGSLKLRFWRESDRSQFEVLENSSGLIVRKDCFQSPSGRDSLPQEKAGQRRD